jgi:hypothetical protein
LRDEHGRCPWRCLSVTTAPDVRISRTKLEQNDSTLSRSLLASGISRQPNLMKRAKGDGQFPSSSRPPSNRRGSERRTLVLNSIFGVAKKCAPKLSNSRTFRARRPKSAFQRRSNRHSEAALQAIEPSPPWPSPMRCVPCDWRADRILSAASAGRRGTALPQALLLLPEQPFEPGSMG